MGIPTETEAEQAIKTAIAMREQGNDPDFIAKALLNYHYRLEKLEKLLEVLEKYLHSGESARQHAQLLHMLEDYQAYMGRQKGHDVII